MVLTWSKDAHLEHAGPSLIELINLSWFGKRKGISKIEFSEYSYSWTCKM